MSYAPDTLQPADQWRTDAACTAPQYADQQDMWFAEDGDPDRTTAVRICLTCPARQTCLDKAMADEKGNGRQSRWGIRGGLTARQRWNADRNVRDREPKPNDRPQAPCGTPAAYERHRRNQEPIDQPCRDAHAKEKRDRNARRRAAEQGGCGTRSGYRKHRSKGEPACAPCRQANADADRLLRNAGTTKRPVKESRLPAGGARCGTNDGYDAHKRWKEQPCQPCQDAHDADTQQRQADARAAADAPSLPTCGTRTGYDTHTARGEAPCQPCTDARASTDWLLRTTLPPAA